MNKVALWARASRAPFIQAAIIPVVVGFAASYYETGTFKWALFVVALVANGLVNLGANLMNDYYDELSGNDRANTNFTKFSGGSRLIQDNVLSKGAYMRAGIMCYGLATILGIYLATASGPLLYVIGVIGLVFSYLYSAAPVQLSYRGLGELTVMILFGPLSVIGAAYVNNPEITLYSLLISFPVSVLVGLILFINEFPDYDADRSVGKNTLVVRMGRQRSRIVYEVFLASIYVYVLVLVGFGLLPVWALLVALTLPIAAQALKASASYDNTGLFIVSMESTIKLHLAFGVLLAISLVIGAMTS